jgi:hypothetical protein
MKFILRNLFLFCLLNNGANLFAQQLFSTAGNYFENGTWSISYSIGEMAIETFSSPNKLLTQGFQQNNLFAVSIRELKELDFEISVYPNPVQDIVTLQIPAEKMGGKQYKLYDTNGKLLEIKSLEEAETKISFSQLIPAAYLLKICEGEKELKTVKIVKQ